MNIISIDFSKFRTGVFTKINGEENTFTISNKSSATQGDALVNIYSSFKKILAEEKFHFGIIELYGFNPKNKRSMIVMAEIGGVIRLAFAQSGTPLLSMPIQTWKMLTIGKISKSDKQKYLTAVKTKYGKEFVNTDEADAFMIYLAARIIAWRTKNLSGSILKIKNQLEEIIRLVKSS